MNNRGVAFIVAYMVIVVLLVLGTVLMSRSIQESSLTQRFAHSTQAFWLAEAGIQRALYELNTNDCHGLKDTEGAACASCSACLGFEKSLSGTLGSTGDFETTINMGNREISSRGYVPNKNDAKNIQRAVKVDLPIISPPLFDKAVCGRGQITLGTSAYVDAYDSSLGLYGVNGNRSFDAEVASDGTSAGIVNLGTSAIIYGKASTGPGGTVALGTSADVLPHPSDINDHTNDINKPSVTVTDEAKAGGKAAGFSGDNISLGTSGQGTIPAGIYKYDRIVLGTSAALTFTGDVTIYLTGTSTQNSVSLGTSSQLKINSGAKLTLYCDKQFDAGTSGIINNTAKIPQNFQLYSTYTGTNGVKLSTSSQTYGAIYGPDTTMSFGTSTIVYGLVVAKTASLGTSCVVHYDKALGRLDSSGSGTYIPYNWQEQ